MHLVLFLGAARPLLVLASAHLYIQLSSSHRELIARDYPPPHALQVIVHIIRIRLRNASRICAGPGAISKQAIAELHQEGRPHRCHPFWRER